MPVKIFLSLLLVLSLCTCGPAPSEPAEDTPAPEPEATIQESEATPAPDAATVSPYQVKDGALLGMRAGEPVADFKSGLRSGVLSTGEGDFPVYYIDGAEGTELGYLMLDDAETVISDITITSPDVATEAGVSVGMTYAELQNILGEFEVHGSEIEGYTYAQKDGYWYRLDAGNWSYEIDPSTLQPDTRILSIGLPY